MTDSTVKHSGSQVIKMVWVITLLGFGVGVFMLAIVYITLSRIHTERKILSDFQVNMTRMVTSVDADLDRGGQDIDSLLNLAPQAPESDRWLDDLFEKIVHYRKISDSPDIQISLNALQDSLRQLHQTRKDCMRYHFEMSGLLEDFPDVNSAIDATLGKMRSAIIRIEGRQRLERAVAIRKYRRTPSGHVARPLGKIIADLDQEAQIITIKTEIADLTLLCERLRAEDQIDNLADLKDNKFKASLDRLKRGVSLYNQSHGQQSSLPASLIEKFESRLFGAGFKSDAVHQTIIPGRNGLFPLCRRRLELEVQRKRLLNITEQLFNQTRKSREKLVLDADELASATAQSAEQALQNSWQTMLWVWLLSTSAFLILSTRIARTAKRQIKTIETANRTLQNEVEERLRIENDLIQSREDLHKAKSELEVRVEERTRELKEANEQLGNEIEMRKQTGEQLRQRGQELAKALTTARKARRIAETERDRSERALAQVTESNRRLEILISDATAREEKMVTLKREINELCKQAGLPDKYKAPAQVDRFLVEHKDSDPSVEKNEMQSTFNL